jgi:lipoprotein NlpD
MRLTAAALIGLGILGLQGGCASTADSGEDSYQVQPQDTLYSIAWRHDLDFRDLARWNGIGADYRIAVGQTLRLRPGPAGDPGAVAAPPREPGMARSAPKPQPSVAHATGPPPAWTWPTAPPLAPKSVRGGVVFAGRLGQPILAAAGGRIVYTGSGIRGLGELIIIKHSDTLLSAYAYNREVKVHEGEDVRAGQTIAAMGQDAAQQPALYFEIRLNGQAVDPLPYLSVRK